MPTGKHWRREFLEHSHDTEQLNKWRLMLGRYADNQIPFGAGSKTMQDMDNVLDYLYSREYGEDEGVRDPKELRGGSGQSQLTVSKWINEVNRLFPKETIEVLEKEALDRYGMTELLTDESVLEKLEPNQELLKLILQLKGLMSPKVLSAAKQIVRRVVEELRKKFEQEIRQSLTGRVDKNQESPVASARNLDMKKTILRNLKHYDKEKERLILEKVYFYSRVRQNVTWHVVICVDESGSMLDSVIHSAVMAGIFASLPMLETKLVIFDTNVVDLSESVDDAVETLMSVQLGGGTDIGKAMRYCETLVTEPERTIFVLVTDLYEGGRPQEMYACARGLVEAGVKVMILTALDKEANPNYDRKAAAKMAALGANVAAMTPGELADWVGGIIHE
ncbi:MAG: VWA domain-containing protein [Lachnospiraceae bacterium]|nr:VWA domain-containing protein [Lachnospiraceae bacterium]